MNTMFIFNKNCVLIKNKKPPQYLTFYYKFRKPLSLMRTPWKSISRSILP